MMIRGLAIIVVLISLAGCVSKTQYGPCIGAFEEKDPHLIYKLSVWNVAMAIIGFELILPPVVVLVNETLCPVGRKSQGGKVTP